MRGMPVFCINLVNQTELNSREVTRNWKVVLWLSTCNCYFVWRASVHLWKLWPKKLSSQKYKDPLCQNISTNNTKGLKLHQTGSFSRITYERKTLKQFVSVIEAIYHFKNLRTLHKSLRYLARGLQGEKQKQKNTALQHNKISTHSLSSFEINYLFEK